MFEKIKKFKDKVVNFAKARIHFIKFRKLEKKQNEKINMQKVKEVRVISNSGSSNWNWVY